jgi:hypothetical protein
MSLSITYAVLTLTVLGRGLPVMNKGVCVCLSAPWEFNNDCGDASHVLTSFGRDDHLWARLNNGKWCVFAGYL